ncbi:mitotic centromere-associated kinesin (MCAK) [Trypanosoma cruzi Dm28c]|uniref:Kinesin-like protein n=2 Tax=Trypanosoma cruzi TaxID=5693 RepID=V5DET8_TRYCR|nr:mitotic centromere-associated kinesin (MCAK) [Trypanosoma cruzi Dm28c]PBJ68406.1 mitotic centromere-associated kinesin (MCAK) [Trypanosoma cruzi cruzi]PWU91230.1 putative Kinesin-13 4 [Trypanosoma cruzi]
MGGGASTRKQMQDDRNVWNSAKRVESSPCFIEDEVKAMNDVTSALLATNTALESPAKAAHFTSTREALTRDDQSSRNERRGQCGLRQSAPSPQNLFQNFESLSRELRRLSARRRAASTSLSGNTSSPQLPSIRELPGIVQNVTPRGTGGTSLSPRVKLLSCRVAVEDNSRVASPASAAASMTSLRRLNEGILRRASMLSQNATPAGRTRGGRIRVVVRKRPMMADEMGSDCVSVKSPWVHISVKKLRVDLTDYEDVNEFMFDDAFAEDQKNVHVFERCSKDLIATTLDGGSASCFAYGQTGSGKTHTMLGNDQEKGLYLLAAAELFAQLTPEHEVYVSLYEIYCNSLFDLLMNRTPVVVREDHNHRVNICGLSWHNVSSAEELFLLISSGTDQRRTGSTSANERSSRSHVVLTIRVFCRKDASFCGTLNFVDLAGSERASETSTNDKQTRQEGAEINKSLLALKECIRALDEKKKHVPFRGSKLTEILRDSFTGNSRTVMIANISASSCSYDHTVNTLRYAFRVKGLSIANIVPSKARNAPRPMRQAVSEVPPLLNFSNIAAADAPARKAKTPPTGTNGRRGLSTQRGRSCTPKTGNLNVQRGNMNPIHQSTIGDTHADKFSTYLRAVTHEKLLDLLPPAKLREMLNKDTSNRDGGAGTSESSTVSLEEKQLLAEMVSHVVEKLKAELGSDLTQNITKRDRLIRKLRDENGALRRAIVTLEKRVGECPRCRQRARSNSIS